MAVLEKPNVFGLTTRSKEHEEPVVKTSLITQRKVLLEDKANEVIQKILKIALNDEHPKQDVFLKWAGDRMLPVSEFEKDKGQGGIKTVIIDRSCGGKVIIKTGDSSIEMETDEYLTIEGNANGQS